MGISGRWTSLFPGSRERTLKPNRCKSPVNERMPAGRLLRPSPQQELEDVSHRGHVGKRLIVKFGTPASRLAKRVCQSRAATIGNAVDRAISTLLTHPRTSAHRIAKVLISKCCRVSDPRRRKHAQSRRSMMDRQSIFALSCLSRLDH